MKKVLLIALGMVIGASAFAQSGAMWIGGTAGYVSGNHSDANDNTNDQSTSSYEFGPQFGYWLNDNMAVGLNFSFTGSSIKYNDGNDSKSSSSGYNFQPFFRYYMAGSDNFKFFGDLAVDFGGGTSKFEDNTGTTYDDSKYSTFGVGVYAGAQYWFTDNWSMASSIGVLGYDSQTNNKGETDGNNVSKETTDSNFGLIGDFTSLNFSLYYHF